MGRGDGDRPAPLGLGQVAVSRPALTWRMCLSFSFVTLSHTCQRPLLWGHKPRLQGKTPGCQGPEQLWVERGRDLPDPSSGRGHCVHQGLGRTAGHRQMPSMCRWCPQKTPGPEPSAPCQLRPEPGLTRCKQARGFLQEKEAQEDRAQRTRAQV